MKPCHAHWAHFEHGADIGVRGCGPTLADAFAQAALAMTAVITDPNHVSVTTSVALDCESGDQEQLLYDWLNAVIFEMATRRLLFRRFEVQIEGSHLRATAHGESVNAAKHAPAVEIKGATYTALRVYREGECWCAQCVVDV